MSALRQAIVHQFGNPHGWGGHAVSLVMRLRPSNRERSRRTLELLEIEPTDRVLEIGHGPGLAIASAAQSAHRGKVVGLDRSSLMHRQAGRLNAQAVSQGRVELICGTPEVLAGRQGEFDKAFAVNVYMFWEAPVDTLRLVGATLRPGGAIAITNQPRKSGATAADSEAAGRRIADDLRAAGFVNVRSVEIPLRPVPGVCVLGRTKD